MLLLSVVCSNVLFKLCEVFPRGAGDITEQ